MLKNCLRIMFRNLLKNKMHSIINISGLALGMACSVLILLWVQNELNYDEFHTNKDVIYRIMSHGKKYFIGGIDGTPAPLAPAISKEIPEIENYARFADINRFVFKYRDKVFFENRGLIADPSIFQMFDFPFLAGDRRTALSEPLDLVVTSSMAERYFGEEDPMGKILEVEGQLAKVTGVLKDIPKNSHIKFDYLSSYEFIDKVTSYGTSWGSFNFVTYIQLSKGADPQEVGRKITEIAKRNKCPQVDRGGVEFRLQPLKSVHLDPRGSYRNYIDIGDRKYVHVFSLIAFLILFIAWINFMNLSTALSSNRAKEVGMRKTIGAHRKDLIIQFLGESVFLSFIAGILALFLILSFIPQFNSISGKELRLGVFNPHHMLIILGIILLTGIFAGSYPAFYLSRFKPITTLKTTLNFGKKEGAFRKVLVVVQFTISIILILSSLVIYKQMRYISNKKLGFDMEHVAYFPIKENIGKKYDFVKKKLLADPNILSVTAQYYLFSSTSMRDTSYRWEGQKPDFQVDMILNLVDVDYFNTLNLEIVEGREFSNTFVTDKNNAFILNEEAIKQMGIKDPIGKRFTYRDRKGVIVGVVKNAYFRSLHHKIDPHVFFVLDDVSSASQYGNVLIKIKGENISGGLAAIRGVWEKVNIISPFEYHFLGQTYDSLYKSEKQTRIILIVFTVLALVISCMGLFGLTAFMAAKRAHEVGIRKVLGASAQEVIALLSKDFIKWIILANVFAWPVAYFLMGKWLQHFAYKTSIQPWIFLLSGLLALIIAFPTVYFISYRAAVTNPVNSLRNE